MITTTLMGTITITITITIMATAMGMLATTDRRSGMKDTPHV